MATIYVAKVVGATSSEGFVVQLITSKLTKGPPKCVTVCVCTFGDNWRH